jgi:altronate dehydratase
MTSVYLSHASDNCHVQIEKDGSIHRIARSSIPKGSAILRYGLTIGFSTRMIQAGSRISISDIDSVAIEAEDIMGYSIDKPNRQRQLENWKSILLRMHNLAKYIKQPMMYKSPPASFGDWATRQHVLILPSVNCSCHVAHEISRSTKSYLSTIATDSDVDCITVNNPSGCGLDRSSAKYSLLLEYYSKLIANPNIFHCLLVSLGCEDAQPEELISRYPHLKSKTTILTIQDEGGTLASIAKGTDLAIQLCITALSLRRVEAPFSALSLALQCGGSDALSGVTANKLIGDISDFIVAHSGRVVLSETPELYGNYAQLIDRSSSLCVSQRLREIFFDWLSGKHGVDPSTNPAPGNLQGGLSNSVEKSLGASQKGGHAPISHVLDYSQSLNGLFGLIIMDSPGYDPVSATGQVLAGCNLLLFSTGRGSCFGIHPLPTIKIATTDRLYNFYQGEIDLAAQSYSGSDDDLVASLQFMVDIASGRLASSERLGYGSDELVFWLDSSTN